MITEPLSDFGIAVRFDEGFPVLYVTGDVDLCTAPALEAVVAGLHGSSHHEIVLDLGGLQFIDGRGLSVIARSASTLRSVGGRLTLRAPNALTRRLLDLTGVGEGLRIEPAKPGDDLIGAIAAAAQIPANQDVVRTALLLVVALAEAMVDGADAVTLSLAPRGPLDDVVAVDPAIAVLDQAQYAVGEGPCLAAAEGAVRFHIAATAREDRWPTFMPLARARGVNSMLSTPVRGTAGAVGALNMYSFRDDAFSDGDLGTAELLARGAADVLHRSASDTSTAALEARVRDAVAARHTIALAQGILMGRQGLSADDAYTALRRESERTSRTLSDVAAAVAASARGGVHDDPVAG